VELMDGKLEVESAPGKGSTFSFDLKLEELPSSESALFNAFTSLHIAKYEQKHPEKSDNYLDNSFEYYATEVRLFDSVNELKKIKESKSCNNYWIDIENAKQYILDSLRHIDKTQLIIIAHVTSRDKLDSLGVPQKNILYKPVTLSKVREVLLRESGVTTEKTHEATMAEVHFDAKVLVAEDNIINQKLIRHILEGSGLTVDMANDGMDAFEKRQRNDYDLIFMDIQMPIMDGVESTHEILAFEQENGEPHIPIVALTAYALKGDRERFLLEKMDDFITKPLDTSDLLTVLNKYLGNKVTKESKETQERATDSRNERIKELTASREEKLTADTKVPAPKEIQEPVMQQREISQKKKTEKKILLANSSLLEGRILAKMIAGLNLDYATLHKSSNLDDEIGSGHYDILVIDSEMLPEDLSSIEDQVAVIVLPEDNTEEILPDIKRGTIAPPALTKEILEVLINKYRV
ncbi:MAG TPA: response regulator, partial [Epsilonproteobacteria bacterium]|nr:response regulator [Campylobacterota bacterium]